MNVKTASKHINGITKLCEEINQFEESLGDNDLSSKMGFLSDAVGFLCDYRKILEKGIEEAELKL